MSTGLMVLPDHPWRRKGLYPEGARSKLQLAECKTIGRRHRLLRYIPG